MRCLFQRASPSGYRGRSSRQIYRADRLNECDSRVTIQLMTKGARRNAALGTRTLKVPPVPRALCIVMDSWPVIATEIEEHKLFWKDRQREKGRKKEREKWKRSEEKERATRHLDKLSFFAVVLCLDFPSFSREREKRQSRTSVKTETRFRDAAFSLTLPTVLVDVSRSYSRSDPVSTDPPTIPELPRRSH